MRWQGQILVVETVSLEHEIQMSVAAVFELNLLAVTHENEPIESSSSFFLLLFKGLSNCELRRFGFG
jgi:hypothetical protein